MKSLYSSIMRLNTSLKSSPMMSLLLPFAMSCQMSRSQTASIALTSDLFAGVDDTGGAGNSDLEPTAHYVVRETYKYSSPLFFHGLSPLQVSLALNFPCFIFSSHCFWRFIRRRCREKNVIRNKNRRQGMSLEKLNLMLDCKIFLTLCYTFLLFRFWWLTCDHKVDVSRSARGFTMKQKGSLRREHLEYGGKMYFMQWFDFSLF